MWMTLHVRYEFNLAQNGPGADFCANLCLLFDGRCLVNRRCVFGGVVIRTGSIRQPQTDGDLQRQIVKSLVLTRTERRPTSTLSQTISSRLLPALRVGVASSICRTSPEGWGQAELTWGVNYEQQRKGCLRSCPQETFVLTSNFTVKIQHLTLNPLKSVSALRHQQAEKARRLLRNQPNSTKKVVFIVLLLANHSSVVLFAAPWWPATLINPTLPHPPMLAISSRPKLKVSS